MKTKSAVLVPIPMALALAVAQYYHNRSRQYTSEYVSVGDSYFWIQKPRKDFKWDKNADEQNIFDVAHKHGFKGGQSCCGTVWFRRGKYCYEIGEGTWPKAQRSIAAIVTQPLAAN